MKPQPLSIDLLRLDGGTQNRITIDEDVVQDYSELIAEANGEWPLGPLDVFHDGSDYFVADGFHRTLAGQRARRASIPCRVHKGTAIDARVFGMTANDRHGKRMSRADKRSCVEWLLDNSQRIGTGKLTQTEIATKAGVSRRTVQEIVADRRKAQNAPSGNSGNYGNTQEEHAEELELGKCPNCGYDVWETAEFGYACLKCHHPHGEPVGDTDAARVDLQRKKTVKTAEALTRAFDDLEELDSRPESHGVAIEQCNELRRLAKTW